MAACIVSDVDVEGLRHAVEVEAESKVFRHSADIVGHEQSPVPTKNPVHTVIIEVSSVGC